MGQSCSSRKAKKTATRPDSGSGPPPYSAPKSPIPNLEEKNKEGPPALSSHPALREQAAAFPALSAHPAVKDQNAQFPNFVSFSGPTSKEATTEPLIWQKKQEHRFLASTSFVNPTVSKTERPQTPDPDSQPKKITASSTPQWRWTNTQCRAWLADVLIEYGGRPSPEAHRVAQGFKGWGPNLYMKEWKAWNSWLGADGQAIFALLMEEHEKEGAVPREVEILHYILGERDVGEGKEEGRGEIDNFVEREVVDEARQQLASEWGKERLRQLAGEREKLRLQRERSVKACAATW